MAARPREVPLTEPGPARPQEAIRPRRTREYVEGCERRERSWRSFSTLPFDVMILKTLH